MRTDCNEFKEYLSKHPVEHHPYLIALQEYKLVRKYEPENQEKAVKAFDKYKEEAVKVDRW